MTILKIIYGTEIKPERVSYLAISAFIYAIAYKGLKQPEKIVFNKRIDDSDKTQSKPYLKSGLDDTSAKSYVKTLLKVMDEDKPYKNERLNLTDLSKMLGVSTHNLSEIINTRIEQNFYDFINYYRVEEAKKIIDEDINKTYSILTHGMEAGFSSKSAFYSAFKKFTGMTPAQFRSRKI